MSTRAVFTFIDDHDTYHIYRHHDGYPKGAARALAKTAPLAWNLPRFEADEFGAAFVAANKERPGGIRLTDHWRNHRDLEYRYEIFQNDDVMKIHAFAVSCSYPENLWKSQEVFCGPLREFIIEHTQAEETSTGRNKTPTHVEENAPDLLNKPAASQP